MIDLYKRLNVLEDASDETIRQRLTSIDATTRAAAEMVLLDPRRRGVYDRNRRLLVTIGQLRFKLGLSYTRFWARGDFKDFWQHPAFTPPPSDKKPKRRVDKMMIAQAFYTVSHHGRRHAARWGGWWIAVGAGGAGAFVVFVLWWAFA
jgi:hypothetical protein